MSTQNEATTLDALDDRHIDCCERLPDDPPPGNYVVIDVIHFSTTVVELLANDAAYVHVTERRGDEFAFRERHPEARIGGGSTDEYEPEAGYDFFNSPSYVQSVDVAGRPVSMTSSNGGRAVSTLRAADADVDVYVGGTTNAAAVGRALRDDPAPTHLVSAGSGGEPSTEDRIGAIMVARYLEAAPLADLEVETYRELLQYARGPGYLDKHEVRRRDVTEFVTAVNRHGVVPKLDGDRLVDVADDHANPTPAAEVSS